MITADQVRQLLDYSPETGEIRWKVDRLAGRKSVRIKAGAIAGGTSGSHGYRVIFIGKSYLAHRLVWLHVYGEWPPHQVDHINGDRLDNRLCNLRCATDGENKRNMKRRADNRSGFKGVIYCKLTGRWRARIKVDGKIHELGRHNTPELAHAAYVAAAQKHHGKFARAA